MDKGGIQIGHLGRGYLPRCERSYRTGASGAQTGRVGICNNIGNWDMSWTRTTIRKGYYRPQQEAVVQVASEGKISVILFFVCEEARELGGLILATEGGLLNNLFFVPWILGGFFSCT